MSKIYETETSTYEKQLNLQYRTMDMLLTIYEKLSGRYRIFTGILDLLLLFSSITLCLTTFVDLKILQYLLITPEKKEIILSISALLTFVLSIIFLMIDWKKKVSIFSQAAETLRKLKSDCREKIKRANPEELSAGYIGYSSVINNLPQISERDFQRLKAYHKRQAELNKMIELYPGSSIGLLRILVSFKANLNLLLRRPMTAKN